MLMMKVVGPQPDLPHQLPGEVAAAILPTLDGYDERQCDGRIGLVVGFAVLWLFFLW